MPFIEAPTTFYLGRRYDPETQRLVDEVVYYDSRDLTTHAVVVGMTGSGKTGMCITLLEEAVLDNIPAIVIDPKGDITNLLLTFPNLLPSDFAPWVNASDAQRAGMELTEFAEDVAQQWRDGLASWSIVPQRIGALKNAAQFSIYTPGSDAGLPISILASLQAPRVGWQGHEEFHREQISGIVRALMALIGKQVDPVKDREHVLISNIFEEAWKAGRDLTLEDIILQVQSPPFARLGVFDVNTFFPEKDRFKLAKELNNIIASPSFQTWIYGEPLDMRRLLYTTEGRPRVSIFYLAHLTDAERTFIITLLLENMIAWMRTLSGTTSLRAMLYFDEVFGHFPPAPRNPPTKEPLLTLLKQGRAFGIGTVLATQNPGDLDYKGLSNAGTWFIGKLQTDNDKKRVMGGLEAAATANTRVDTQKLDQLISSLAPRVFMLHNVHEESGPILMHSRWAMSYLRGPLTRQQVRALMERQRRGMGLETPPLPQQLGTGPRPPVSATPVQPSEVAPVAQPVSSPAPTVPPRPPLPDEMPPGSLRSGTGGTPVPPEQSGSRTPLPPSLPEASSRPMSATPPPSSLPGEKAVSEQSAGGTFLDRLAKETPKTETPTAPDSHQPSNPFAAFRTPTPPEKQLPVPLPEAEPPPSLPAEQGSSFWLTPDPQARAVTPPPTYIEPEDDALVSKSAGALPAAPRGTSLPEGYADRPPALPSTVAQFYLPTTITTQQAVRQWEQRSGYVASPATSAKLLYRPVLLAQLAVRYIDRKSGVETDQHWAFHVPGVESAGFVRWNEYLATPISLNQLGNSPFGEAAYGVLPGGLTDPKRMKTLRDEVLDYVARSATLVLLSNSTLGIYGQPNEDRGTFITRAQQLAREERDQEIDTVTAKYDKILEDLDRRLRREMRQLTSDQQVLDELKREDLYTTGEAVLSLLKGRTTYTLSRMSRARRYKKQAQEKASSNELEIIAIEDEIEAKQKELQAVLQEINQKWGKIAQTVEEHKVKPFKKDIAIEVFGIGWAPSWYTVLNGQSLILPAYVSNPVQQPQ